MEEEMEEKKDINLKGIDGDLYWAIKRKAVDEKTTVKELICRVMRQYLKKEGGERYGKGKKKRK